MSVWILTLVVAYLLGSIPFGYLLVRFFRKEDIRSVGSGNIGATNVARSGARGLGLLTLLLDLSKGLVAVVIARHWAPGTPGFPSDLAVAAAVAAVVGHIFPVWLGFKGGKGVATALGVLLGLNPWLGLATLATWLIIVAFFRYSSLASLVAAVFAPFYEMLIWDAGPEAGVITVMSLLLIWRHAPNISKLLAGTESKLFAKAPAAGARRAR